MKSFKSLIGSIIVLLFAILIIESCESPSLVDNPPPFIEIIAGPHENQVLDKDEVYFKWKGNK